MQIVQKWKKVIGCPLSSMEELHSSRRLLKAQTILKDPSHQDILYLRVDGAGY